MSNYHYQVPNEERVRTEASSKSVKKYNRELANSLGVDVPPGSPTEAKEELLEIVRVILLLTLSRVIQ